MHLDLHRHLEGSHSAQALAQVARDFDVRTAPFWREEERRFLSAEELRTSLTMAAPTDDAAVFYQCIVKARAAYVSVPAIAALARMAVLEAAAETDGFEMRLSLFSMARTLLDNQRIAWRELAPVRFAESVARPILLAVFAARAEAERATGKPMLLRLGLSRTFESEPHYRALANMVVEHAEQLVGLDVLGIVTGPDKEPLPAALVAILNDLRKHVPDLSVHAGEFEGHAAVDRTLALEPQGIGHGVHALESPATLARLVQEGVTLEVCPSSNRLLIPSALAKLEAAHRATPLLALQRAEVHCVLGSDDPTPMGTSFDQELRVAERLGVDLARLEADERRRWAQLSGPSRGV